MEQEHGEMERMPSPPAAGQDAVEPGYTDSAHERDQKVMLRTLPLEYRFLQDTYEEQMAAEIFDRTPNKTRLQANVMTVMALNEVAAARGKGFFYHLPSREALKGRSVNKGEEKDRLPQQPGPQFPTLAYVDYAWSEEGRRRFHASPHRARFLLCDGLLSPPPDGTPVHCIQYASHQRYQVYATPRPSSVVLQKEDAFRLIPCAEFEAMLRLKAGSLQLMGLVKLWGNDGALDRFRHGDVESLYHGVVRLYELGDVTMTAEELRGHAPRPGGLPKPGIPLGTVDGEANNNVSGPKSRKGATLTRKRKRQDEGAAPGERPADDSEGNGDVGGSGFP